MATPILKVELREDIGTGSSNQIRKEGYVPGVLYGHNKDTKNIKVKTQDLQKIVSSHGSGTLVTIDLNGEKTLSIVKDLQTKIVKDEYLHVDFQELSENEEVKLTIPVYVENKDAVEDKDTIVQQQLMEIEVQSLPKNIVHSITIDAARLKDGGSITVGDLDIEGVEILDNDEEVIASLTGALSQEEEEEEEDTTEELETEDEEEVLE
mgnify:CR=1 FL=1